MDSLGSDNKYIFPRSYIGRAIMYLFASPIALIALYWIELFISFAIGSVYKFYYYYTGALERPLEVIHETFFDCLFGYCWSYIRHVVVFVLQCVYNYFDIVFTTSIFAFVVWIFIRFSRNGKFGEREWFKVFSYSAILWFLLPVVYSVMYYCTSDAYPSFLDFFFQNLSSFISYFVRSFILYFIASKLFLSCPYSDDASWSNEISGRRLISSNIRFIVFKLRNFGKKRVALFLFAFAILDIILWRMQSY